MWGTVFVIFIAYLEVMTYSTHKFCDLVLQCVGWLFTATCILLAVLSAHIVLCSKIENQMEIKPATLATVNGSAWLPFLLGTAHGRNNLIKHFTKTPPTKVTQNLCRGDRSSLALVSIVESLCVYAAVHCYGTILRQMC